MSPGRKRDPDESWANALGGIEPLSGREDRVVDRKTPRAAAGQARSAAFHFPDPDNPGLGIASGVNDAQLRRLRSGNIAPERRADLHGLSAAEARSACLGALCAAIDAGERCVLVVHGKGHRSKQGAVLRPMLPTWLADPRLRGRVLAFSPAQPRDGGSGASYVLLRRARDRAPTES